MSEGKKSVAAPQRQKAQLTREALLRAAREKFTVDGYVGSSLDAIVKHAGVTKGALFHHFKDKADLFLQVMLGLEQEMNMTANKAAVEIGRANMPDNPFAGFIAGCGVYFDYSARQDYRRIVMMDGAAVIGEFEWRRIDSELGMKTINSGLQFLYDQKAIRTPPTPALTVMIQGAVNGAGFAIARGDQSIHKEDLLARIETTLRLL